MQYCIGFYKGTFLNHQLKVTDEELASYGLDDPELTVRVDYTDDGTSDTFVLHISRAPEERKEAADSGSEADTADITDYTRIGDFKIIYRLSGSSYETLIAADYDDLRNQEISPRRFRRGEQHRGNAGKCDIHDCFAKGRQGSTVSLPG